MLLFVLVFEFLGVEQNSILCVANCVFLFSVKGRIIDPYDDGLSDGSGKVMPSLPTMLKSSTYRVG